MPTISIKRHLLFQALGHRYTDDEFADLCFDFGIELDDITTEQLEKAKESGVEVSSPVANQNEEDIIYKIEIPANRYDLLCLEGLAMALRVFLKKDDPPVFRTTHPEHVHRMIAEDSVEDIRPFVVCAILRGVTFNAFSYRSFIDIQEKLHQNICRQRTLVSVGTHDLSTIQGPFVYKAIPPREIKFIPLNRDKLYDGVELMDHLKQDQHLKAYVPIIEDKPKYPVIYDSNGVVLSVPPLINGEHSKITVNTKDIFIEVTATDHTKAEIVLNIICAMFSQYCEHRFTVEPVEVIRKGAGHVYPNMQSRETSASLSYINSLLGLSLSSEDAVGLLNRMLLAASPDPDGETLHVKVPPTRSDVLHECDIAEDVGIAFGFNNLEIVPPKTVCTGGQQPLNALTDLLRVEVANAGYTELLSFALCSRAENFEFLRHEDDGQTAVSIANAATREFEVGRTSLLVGLLKTLAHNLDAPHPLKVFEVSDVLLLNAESDVGAINRRHLSAVYCDTSSGFQFIHGLLDFVMQKLGISQDRYWMDDKSCKDGAFLEGIRANVVVDGKIVGALGVLHPEVLQKFKLNFPCSALEIDIEHFV